MPDIYGLYPGAIGGSSKLKQEGANEAVIKGEERCPSDVFMVGVGSKLKYSVGVPEASARQRAGEGSTWVETRHSKYKKGGGTG